MDSSASPHSTATAGPSHPRSLNDPVLSSVEEELNAARGEAAGSGWTADAQSMGSAGTDWWPQAQDRLGRWVGERPGQAALVALGAGALFAALLGQSLRGRRRRD